MTVLQTGFLPCGMLVSSTYGTNISHIKGNIIFCSHAQWYCKWVSVDVQCSCAGTTSFILYFTQYRIVLVLFSLFFLCVVCHSDSPISFLGWLYSLCYHSREGSRFSLVIPCQDICLFTLLAPKYLSV